MTQKRAAVICTIGVAAVCLMWIVWIWANWMADGSKEDFAKTCEALNSKTQFEGDAWICIRDNEVVYP